MLGIANGELEMYTGQLYTYRPAGGDRRASTAAGGNPGDSNTAGAASGTEDATTEVATSTSSSLSRVKSIGLRLEYP